VEALAVAKPRDVRLFARREIVEGEDLEPFVEQELRQVRADEAGPAGDQSPHALSRVTASAGSERLLVKPL
jgi:hypothetical protein